MLPRARWLLLLEHCASQRGIQYLMWMGDTQIPQPTLVYVSQHSSCFCCSLLFMCSTCTMLAVALADGCKLPVLCFQVPY